MKKEKLIDAMGKVDDKYIEEAHKKVKHFNFGWDSFGKLAAVACCLLLIINLVPNLIRKGKSFNGYGVSEEGVYYDGMSDAVASSEMAMDMEMPNNAFSVSGNTIANNIKQVNKKLIVNGDLTIQTAEFDKTIESLNKDIEELGAYVQSSSISSANNEQRYFNATIRIPADKYQELVSKAKSNFDVTYYNERTDDVTTEYMDLDARLKSLKTEEEKVLEFYDKATSLEELMTVESRLTDIRYEIDSIETSLKNYDLLVTYSTLTISVCETKNYTKGNFFSRVAESFTNGFTNLINSIEDLFVGLVYNIWIVILVIVVIVVIYRIYKKRKKDEA